jgi:hypothetical protein
MFRPNWLPSLGIQVVEETAAPTSRCYTLHSKGVKYLYNIFKSFIKYHAVIVLLSARVVGLVCLWYIIMGYISIILYFYHCSFNITYNLLVCWCLSFVLCVAVLNVSSSWFCFYIGGRMCLLLTGVHFLLCSEYWVMCINACVIHA